MTEVLGVRQPWGSSAQSAVRWAFALLASIGAVSSVLGDLQRQFLSKGRRELALIELRAQAGIIRGMVEKLEDPIARAYLIAYYTPKPMEERPGGGRMVVSGGRATFIPANAEFVDRFRKERETAVHTLAVWLESLQGTGVHRVRGYQEIVAHYCLGQRLLDRVRRLTRKEMGIEQIAKLMKMRKEDAIARREQCIKLLLDLEKRAHALIDAELSTAGLI